MTTTIPEIKKTAEQKMGKSVESMKGELQKMLPKTLSIERLLKVAQIAATTTPALAKCDVPSLVGAIGQCAQMGLEPNTVLGHAYLVPFNTKRKDGQGNERWVNSVQVIIGYKGLIDLARRSGQIVSIGWDWALLAQGDIAPVLNAGPRSNLQLLDPKGYDLQGPRHDQALWGLICQLPWEEGIQLGPFPIPPGTAPRWQTH